MRHHRLAAALFSVLVLSAAQAHAETTFLIQLGSFADRGQAMQKWDSLKKTNPALLGRLSPHISETTLSEDGSEMFRTQAGPLSSKDEAKALCGKLIDKGEECFVVETAMFVPDEAPAPAADVTPPPAPPAAEPAPYAMASTDDTAMAGADRAFMESMMTSTSSLTAEEASAVPPPVAEAPPPPPPPPPAIEAPAPSEARVDSNLPWLNQNTQTAALDAPPIGGDSEPLPPPPAPNLDTPPPPPPAPLPFEERSVRDLPPPPAPPAPAPEPMPQPVAAPTPLATTSGVLRPPAPTMAPLPEGEQAVRGEVEVSEAVRVPLTDMPAMTAPASPSGPSVRPAYQAGYRGYPSQDMRQKTLWAQMGYFSDDRSAMGYWQNLMVSNSSIAEGLRARVTRPLGLFGRAQRLSLQVGPLDGVDSLNALCALAQRDGLTCSAVRDLGSSGSATRARVHGVSGAASYAAAPGMTGTAWVQLGSYGSPADATYSWNSMKRSHGDLLKSLDYTVTSPPMSSGRPVYRLRTGPFSTSSAAYELCGKMKSRGVGCLVLSGN